MADIAQAAAGGALQGAFISGGNPFVALGFAALAVAPLLIDKLFGSKEKTPQQTRKFIIRSAAAPRQVVYGTALVEDPVLAHFETTENNAKLHLILMFAGHEIEAFDQFYFGDELVGARNSAGTVTEGRFASKARIITHLGAADQAADATAVADLADWSETDTLTGIAYAYLTLTGDATLYPNGPPAVSALIRGKRVKHYSDGGVRWTDNAALCALDYLIDPDLGFAADASLIDPDQAALDEAVADEMVGLVFQTFSFTVDEDAAELTLENAGLRTGDRVTFEGDPPAPLVAGEPYYWIKTAEDRGQVAATLADARAGNRLAFTGAGSEPYRLYRQAQPRYTTNGSFLNDRVPLDVMEALVAAMAGTPMLNASGYRLRAGADQAVAGALDATMLAGDVTIEPRRPFRELYNAVTGTYRDADNLWAETDFPEQTSSTFQDEDGGVRLVRDLEMEFTDETERAQRLARIDLAQSRQQLRVDWPGNYACLAFERGDLVEVTLAEAGFEAKQFWVAHDELAADGNGYNLTLIEAASGLFDIDLETLSAADPAPNSNILTPGYLVPPTAVAFRTRPVETSAGDTLYLIDVYGTASSDAAVSGYEAALFAEGDTGFADPLDTKAGPADPIEGFPFRLTFGPVSAGTEYVIRLRAVTRAGVRSAWATSSSFNAADEAGGGGGAPSAPTSVVNTQEVTGITPISPGSGTIAFTGGGGSGAAGTASFSQAEGDDSGGGTYTITAGGSGYTSAPSAGFGGDDGFGESGGGGGTGTGIIGNPTHAHLTWTDPVDADLARIDVYRSQTNDTGTAVKRAVAAAGVEAASVALTVTAGSDEYFWLKAVDESGNESGFTATITVTRDA